MASVNKQKIVFTHTENGMKYFLKARPVRPDNKSTKYTNYVSFVAGDSIKPTVLPAYYTNWLNGYAGYNDNIESKHWLISSNTLSVDIIDNQILSDDEHSLSLYVKEDEFYRFEWVVHKKDNRVRHTSNIIGDDLEDIGGSLGMVDVNLGQTTSMLVTAPAPTNVRNMNDTNFYENEYIWIDEELVRIDLLSENDDGTININIIRGVAGTISSHDSSSIIYKELKPDEILQNPTSRSKSGLFTYSGNPKDSVIIYLRVVNLLGNSSDWEIIAIDNLLEDEAKSIADSALSTAQILHEDVENTASINLIRNWDMARESIEYSGEEKYWTTEMTGPINATTPGATRVISIKDYSFDSLPIIPSITTKLGRVVCNTIKTTTNNNSIVNSNFYVREFSKLSDPIVVRPGSPEFKVNFYIMFSVSRYHNGELSTFGKTLNGEYYVKEDGVASEGSGCFGIGGFENEDGSGDVINFDYNPKPQILVLEFPDESGNISSYSNVTALDISTFDIETASRWTQHTENITLPGWDFESDTNTKSFRIALGYRVPNWIRDIYSGSTLNMHIDAISIYSGSLCKTNSPFVLTEDMPGADLAEEYLVSKDDSITKGTIVSFSDDFNGKPVIKTAYRKDNHSPLMIVSDKFWYNLSDDNSKDNNYNSASIALCGRVPCSVIGPVLVGDRVTIFDNGVGRKALNGESIIGYAITKNNNPEGLGEILVLVRSN